MIARKLHTAPKQKAVYIWEYTTQAEGHMPDQRSDQTEPMRLFSCYLDPAEDGLAVPALMLCEMIGNEIQSISLRVAAEGMMRGATSTQTLLRPE